MGESVHDQKMKDEFSKRNKVFEVDLEDLNDGNFPLPGISDEAKTAHCYESHFPGADHTEFWKGVEDPDGPGIVVTHPYGMSMDTMGEIVKFCEANGLEVYISADSWYYPTNTIRVMFKQMGQFKQVAYTAA